MRQQVDDPIGRLGDLGIRQAPIRALEHQPEGQADLPLKNVLVDR